jgi:hypothetical protein
MAEILGDVVKRLAVSREPELSISDGNCTAEARVAKKVVPVLDEDTFVKGLLTALATHEQVLQGTRSKLHNAFFEAVLVAEQQGLIDREAMEIDFDPLYEVCPWFDHALTRAQQNLWVNFPNPSYERVQICYKPDEARKVLQNLGNAEAFDNVAVTFLRHLQQR